MVEVKEIEALENGHGLVDDFGGCYHKTSEGVKSHETNRLHTWRELETNVFLRDSLYIV